ncbi:MAG: RNA-guided pseudouridylation complex pseudouridine synthase subunit Cbf5 [Candidatus Bilamarchaeaceae archaeon]
MGAGSVSDLVEDGVIIIDKPCGPTSHEVTSKVKAILGAKRAGHAGTLDPDVSGVLPVALGKATKLLQYIVSKRKVYVGVVRFRKELDEPEIRSLFAEFTGALTQTPPKLSAVRKVPRKRTIHSLEFIEKKGKDILFRADVEAGTYIRTLCTDMGKRFGGGRMIELRRVSVGNIPESLGVKMQDLIDAKWFMDKKGDPSRLLKMLHLPDAFFAFKRVVVKDGVPETMKSGAQLMVPGIASADPGIRKGEIVSLYSKEEKFVGIGTSEIDFAELPGMKRGIVVKTRRIHI